MTDIMGEAEKNVGQVCSAILMRNQYSMRMRTVLYLVPATVSR